jgi:SSS family solute:Na+ symporter
MTLETLDVVVFLLFFTVVIAISVYKSRDERSSEDYFLAGRGLTWGLIGFSLLASNISTEHFVGMSGAGFGNMGLAVASYEWIAVVTLVFVAFFLLPVFLRCGIYTIPEFLEYRYGPACRTLMAVYILLMYVLVAISSVLYSGALGLATMFGVNLTSAVWTIGIVAGAYTVYGGLKAVVWTDLFQGAALLLCGALVMVSGFEAVGGVRSFFEANADKLHLILPADHPEIPWTAMLVGIWIPNLFYWGLNQFITQRTLGARSLAQGQLGIMFAATLKLTVPFIIVFPGIMAFQLYGSEITVGDQAYPLLIGRLLPGGLTGLMFAGLTGAVMSSLDSMLNSASTLFTMDLFRRRRPEAPAQTLIRVGRGMTAVFVVLGCLIAPNLADPRFGGIFRYIQMFQGFISPGIVTVFVFGLLAPRAPAAAALAAMLLNVPVYGLLLWTLPRVAFLNHMAITFSVLAAVMAIVTRWRPLENPRTLPLATGFDLTPSRAAKPWGAALVGATLVLYVVFW